jgi:hypothetical protein
MTEGDYVLALASEGNLRAYALIFAIEVTLRELIIESLSALSGRHWYKTRLPPDVLKKYREGRAKEQTTHWTHFVHHDPLYYIDFPELTKALDNGNNWREAFQTYFGNKEVFLGTLKSLEEIRNKVAHNRKVTQRDLTHLQNAFSMIDSAIGRAKLDSLLAQCTDAREATATVQDLRAEASNCYTTCLNCDPLPSRDHWAATRQSPWLGMLTAELDFTPVEEFFSLMDNYSSLPASLPGFRVERWLRQQRVEETYAHADAVLEKLIHEVSGG